VIGILTACHQPPDLPYEPKISFESVRLAEVTDGPDSLIVSVYFEDGNGDLGLFADETEAPYHPVNVIVDENGDPIYYGTRPPGLPDYNPIDWQILRNNDGLATDTILVEINDNHYNYFVRFYQKIGGDYVEFDWRAEPFYQTFDGRFPYLRNIDDYSDRPLEGSLRYSMLSSGWLYVFRDTLKISVQIQDRALNQSNIVESGDFTMDGIM